ncbi:unnamed protein product [Coffea canephora]|uniref:Protein-serine/threonine kinase n=1 Tax=Coffea canephora TaxID=49390 RepID=A0A068VHE9_COFCA|nr:unnamed protein product [Coffea canephora]
MIKMIKVRHNNVIHQFLDRFYMLRIGICMLIRQHVALHDPNPPPDCVGYIHTKMSTVEDACCICFQEYSSVPDFNIYGDPNFSFLYIPTHLHLVVFELVKNSLHAVQDRFMDSNEVAPPIRIIVTEGIEDVTIKAFPFASIIDLFFGTQVSDEGGGIPRSGLAKIFTYLYGTAKYPLDEQVDLGIFDTTTMAGYGYGLPISCLYARYFGGDLQIISMEGYVMDAYFHLSQLGDSQEPLP